MQKIEQDPVAGDGGRARGWVAIGMALAATPAAAHIGLRHAPRNHHIKPKGGYERKPQRRKGKLVAHEYGERPCA